MYFLAGLAVLLSVRSATAHGHDAHDGPLAGETIQQYAERHMASEHHIDSFDLESFFQLHDLNRDGVWDSEEIEAIYGVHHVYSQKQSKDEVEHQKKAEHIVNSVLKLLDKDGNGKITIEEFTKVGLDGLPNFDNLGAEGHHYDVESEFFLHHEEQFHSTPETQTDESYTHAEDLEHFAAHESIEREEAAREAKFQGISVDEALAQHEPHDHDAPAEDAPVVVEGEAANDSISSIPKLARPEAESEDPAVRYQNIKAQGQWGDDGYKPPRSPSDRLKKNAPYKYKFRRQWGDF